MAMPAFRSTTALHPEGTADRGDGAIARASSRSSRPAANCAVSPPIPRALQRQLGDVFDVTVFDLDQYLLRSPHRRVRKLGDRHIKDICRAIRRFDAVNLQLEYGTLGRYGRDILSPLRLAHHGSAAALGDIPHRLDAAELSTSADFSRRWRRCKFRIAGHMHSAFQREPASCRTASPASCAGCSARSRSAPSFTTDATSDAYLYGIEHVFDHPLFFWRLARSTAIRDGAARRRFPLLDDLPADSVLIGVFGFLNDYKGIGTAIQALYHLPENHHLLIFGGVHPNEIAPRQPRHP